MSIKIILKVPFRDRIEAKAKGAKWSDKLKFWYILSEQSLAPFRKWLPKVAPCEAEAGRHKTNRG